MMGRSPYEWQKRKRTARCAICGREFETDSARRIYCGSDACERERMARKAESMRKLRARRGKEREGMERNGNGKRTDASVTAEDLTNSMMGSLYGVEQTSPQSPTMIGIITIDGVRMRVAVYPERTSLKGRVYNPVRLSYLPGSEFVLRMERVGGR